MSTFTYRRRTMSAAWQCIKKWSCYYYDIWIFFNINIAIYCHSFFCTRRLLFSSVPKLGSNYNTNPIPIEMGVYFRFSERWSSTVLLSISWVPWLDWLLITSESASSNKAQSGILFCASTFSKSLVFSFSTSFLSSVFLLSSLQSSACSTQIISSFCFKSQWRNFTSLYSWEPSQWLRVINC